MKKLFFLLTIGSFWLLTACSNDGSTSTNDSTNRIVGVWESWKEVTDEGETFLLNENGCPTYVDSYNANGTGSEKYFSSWTDCSLITSDDNQWQSLGDSNYKISNGSFSTTHHFIFIDNDTHIQRDEENQSNIYFRRH